MRSIESAEAQQHERIRWSEPGGAAQDRSIGARVVALARLAAAIHIAEAASDRGAGAVGAPARGERA